MPGRLLTPRMPQRLHRPPLRAQLINSPSLEKETMTKNELIGEIAAKSGLSKADANRVLNAVTETIAEALKKGESVPLIGFGTFEVRGAPLVPVAIPRRERN